MVKHIRTPKICMQSLPLQEAERMLDEGLWNFRAINLKRAQEISAGNGVNIAVIDSGVDSNHPELKDSYGGREDFAEDKHNVEDKEHGTFVAGIISGRRTGVAPESKFYSLKVYNSEGCEDDPIRDAIMWCLSKDYGADIDIINISLGSSTYFPLVEDACRRSYRKNVPIVAAAGNNSCGAFFPASHPGVVSIAALEKIGGRLAHCQYSNLWPTTDIAAPGNPILSLEEGGGYCIGEGTSAAAPHVTGVIALGISLLKQEKKPVSAENLEKILKSTSLHLKDLYEAGVLAKRYDPGGKLFRSKRKISGFMFGAGIVQADKFLEALYRKL